MNLVDVLNVVAKDGSNALKALSIAETLLADFDPQLGNELSKIISLIEKYGSNVVSAAGELANKQTVSFVVPSYGFTVEGFDVSVSESVTIKPAV